MTESMIPIMDFTSNGRQYLLSADSLSRIHSIGDAGFVRMEFPVTMTDKSTNMIYAVVTYNIIETSFEQEVSVKDINKYQETINYIVNLEHGFVEPQPPEKDIVLELMKRLTKFMKSIQ